MSMSKFREIQFSDSDVVNLDNWIPDGESNPHKVVPWLIHDHGFPVCIVFASNLQDAFDEAADEGKLERWLIKPGDGDWKDYMTSDFSKACAGLDENCPEYVDGDGVKWWWYRTMPAPLGNASEPFDIDTLDGIELPNPKRSFCAQFNVSIGRAS